jgi:hypothetical protein
MTIQATTFEPSRSGVKALLDQLYDVKFSKHTPLVVVLLSMIYTVYRTRDYLARTFRLADLIAWPTAVFIELLILAASAGVFIALRAAYVAELRQRDQGRSWVGVVIALLLLAAAFVALLIVAWADAYALTHDAAPALVMTLIQFSQMLLVCLFIMFADGEERELLRQQHASYQIATTQQRAGQCPHCRRAVTSNNRARHISVCPMRPEEEV